MFSQVYKSAQYSHQLRDHNTQALYCNFKPSQNRLTFHLSAGGGRGETIASFNTPSAAEEIYEMLLRLVGLGARVCLHADLHGATNQQAGKKEKVDEL